MVVEEMVDDLKVQLNVLNQAGKAPHEFSSQNVILFLNRAQRRIIDRLQFFQMRELEIWAVSQSLGTSGEFDWSTLSPAVFQGEKSILAVKHTGGYYCRIISPHRNRKYEDAGYVFSNTDPRMFFEGNDIFIRPYSGKTIDILYRKIPTAMALDATPANNVDCILNENVQEALLELALYYGYRAGGDLSRARECREEATRLLRILNGGYAVIPTSTIEAARLLTGAGIVDQSISNTARSAMSGSIVTTAITNGIATLSGAGTYILQAETGVEDDLTQLAGLNPGDRIVLMPDAGDTISVKNGTFLKLANGYDFVMNSQYDSIMLTCLDVAGVCTENSRTSPA